MHDLVMAESAGSACEVCATVTEPWRISPGCVLDRCPTCGHLRRRLDAAPADHRGHAYGGEATLDRARLALTFRDLTRDGVPDRVFEVGYGSGALLRRFLDAGSAVGGVDPDQLDADVDPLVAARGDLRRCGVEELAASVAAGTTTAPAPADLVVGVHVLEHVVDPLATLVAVRTLLRPGGRIVFLTPAGDSWGPRLHGAAWWMLEDPTHVRFFTADSLTRLAHAAGFTSVAVDRPLLDSLTTDGASLARRLRPGRRERGVLSSPVALGASVALAPFAVVARLAAPAARTTLRLRGIRGGA